MNDLPKPATPIVDSSLTQYVIQIYAGFRILWTQHKHIPNKTTAIENIMRHLDDSIKIKTRLVSKANPHIADKKQSYIGPFLSIFAHFHFFVILHRPLGNS